MSGWELFTWFNVAVLAGGSVIVFALFLRQRSALLTGESARDEASEDPDRIESGQ